MGLIFYIGITLIAVAVVGLILKMASKQAPFINSFSNQLILTAVGLTFIWVNHDKSVPEEFALFTNTYDSVTLPKSPKVFLDTIKPRIDLLVNRGNRIIDSIKAGQSRAWWKNYFYFTNSVYDAIRLIELFNKDGGTYQAKWFVLARGRHVDGDRPYDSAFALNASKEQVEWLQKLKLGLDSVKAK